MERLRSAPAHVPGDLTLAYYEASRDYQTGGQRASRGEASARSEAIALPIVLSAEEAKQLAERRLDTLWAETASLRLRLGWRRHALRPGAVIAIEGVGGEWKVRRWLLTGTALELELSRLPSASLGGTSATPGRAAAQPDLVHGPTVLRLLDLPLPISAETGGLVVIAAGPSPGWRRAGLLFSGDGGTSWAEIGSTAEPAVMGRSLTMLPAGGSATFDDAAQVDVELLHGEFWLEGCSDAALLAGTNLAVLGDELLQFGRAEPLGNGRFRLSRLLRGRRGTEWAASLHGVGEGFALLEPAAMLPISNPSEIGATVVVIAAGLGDAPEGVRAEREVTREGLRPPAPVHLRAARRSDGGIAAAWTRRSRLGWDWPNGSDTPLGEEREAYRVTVSGGSGSRSFEAAAPIFEYEDAQRAADGISFPITISVAQIGTYGPSRPAAVTIP